MSEVSCSIIHYSGLQCVRVHFLLGCVP